MITYETIIILSWAAFILIWAVSAFNVKRDIRGGYSSWWRQYWLLRIVAAVVIIFIAVRIATGTAHYTNPERVFSVFSNGIFMPPPLLGWIAAVLSIIGVCFAIWARYYLGRNWSPRPAVKEHHELVTTGPYAYVRHPIYTGIILMAFGFALTGSVVGIVAFLAADIVYILRAKKEEKIMLELFPDTYPAYQARTKKLIPFVW